MAGQLELQITCAGMKPVTARLDGILERVHDLRPAFERIADLFQEHMGRVVAGQGRGTRAGAWRPLSERYARRKRRLYPGRGILVATGTLRNALTGRGAGAIREIREQELRVGAAVRAPGGRYDLGLIHQLGAPRARVPMRPMIDPDDATRGRFRKILADHAWSE